MSAQTRGLFRWAGGKARIVETLFAHIDADAHELCPPCVAPHRAPAARWLEPFVGSGAMALAAMRRGIAREYVLADALPDIAMTLHTLARPEAWRAVEETLSRFAAKPVEEQKRVFLELRPLRTAMFDAVMRFLILQACSFNGVYRVNSKGVYNVPFGRAASFDYDALREGAKLLAQHKPRVACQDFERTIEEAAAGDIVYVDPPYLGTHSSYSAVGFNKDAHRRLAGALWRAICRGAVCWLSGSDCAETRTIYAGRQVYKIDVRRSVAPKSANRGVKRELLIRI